MKSGTMLLGGLSLFALHAQAQGDGKVERYREMLLKKPENAVVFGRLVDAWLETGEMAGLKDFLEEKTKSGGTPDWRLLAVFRAHSGDEIGAIEALDEALKLSPDDANVRLARGKALGAVQRFDAALLDLAAAAKDPALALEAGTLRGKFLARSGQAALAVAAWKEVISANPSDQGLVEDLIELELGEGMIDEAVATSRELAAKTQDPYQKALRRMHVAEILAQAGRKEEALAEYREVFAVSADDSWLEREVLARVGEVFTKEDDVVGLRQFYDQLRETYPRRVGVKKEAAKSLMATGATDEAVAMFREVLKVLPGNRGVREEFVAMLEGAGRLKDAAEEISALLVTNETDAALWEKLAGIHQTLKDEAGTNRAVDRAVALAAADEGGKVGVARIYERFGRKEESEKVLRDAVKTYGPGGEAGEALTLLLVKDRPDEAVALWREMAKGADRENLLRISRALSTNGRTEDAYAMLKDRTAEFAGDPLFLAAICQAAQLSGKSDEVVAGAMELVRQAKTAGDLESAVRLAGGIISRSQEPGKWIDELAKKETASTQELCLLAELNETAGDSIAAAKVLKQATSGGDGLLAAAQRVRLYELRGDLPEAIAALREWLAMPGGLKAAQMKRLVDLLDQSGDTAAALAETENWKRIAPGDQLAWLKRVDLFLGDGRPELAVAELRRAIAKFGGDEDMKGKLASALIDTGLVDEGWRMYAGLYDDAESAASKLKWVTALAALAGKEGREEELVGGFRKRARENPNAVAPSLALAEIYRGWKEPEEELAAVAEASRRKPDDVTLLNRLADLEEAAGSVERAQELLRTALRLAPTPDAKRRLSAFRIRNGESDAAVAELTGNANPSANPREGEKLAMSLVPVKNWEAVVKILAAESAAHPEDWRVGYFYAAALRENGSKDQALANFKKLLEADGDLAAVSPLIPQGQASWLKDENGIYYSGLVAPLLRQMALLHRTPQRNRGYYTNNNDPLALPGSPMEARLMALGQVMSMAEEEPEKREALLADVTSSKIADLPLIKRMSALSPEETREQLMHDTVRPEEFQWYVGSNRFNQFSGRQGLDLELLRHCAAVFAKTDPVAEIWVLSSMPLTKDGLGADGARRLLAGIIAQDLDRLAKYQSVLGSLMFAEEDFLPEEVRKQAETRLLAILEKDPGNTQKHWIFESLPIMWIRAGRFDEAATWLNKQYEEAPGASRKASSQASNLRSYLGQLAQGGAADEVKLSTVAAPLVNEFLATEILQQTMHGAPAASDGQKKLLKLLGESGSGQPGQQERINIATLPPMIPKLKDPLLRIFLYDACEQTADVAREIAALEKSSAENGAALRVIAAYYHGDGKDPVKAYSAIVKARDLPKDGSADETIDAELVLLGLKVADKSAAGIDLEPAKRAALRLRKSMGGSEETITQLAGWMTGLGMAEESQRFVAGPKVRQSNRSASSGRSMNTSIQFEPRLVLTKLVQAGKKEAAARRIVAELGRTKGSSNASYEEEQLYQTAVSLNLSEELLAAAKPAEGASFDRRNQYAALLVRLKKPDLALTVLRELAAERPDDTSVLSSLFVLLPEAEKQAALLKLADGKIDEDKLAEWLRSIPSRQSGEKVDEMMASMESFVGFFEKLPASSKADRNLTWINYQALQIFQDHNITETRPVLQRFQGGGKRQYNEERSKRWQQIARRYFEAMLRHPQTCEQGFLLLTAARGPLELSAEDLDRYAMLSLTSAAQGVETEESLSGYSYSGGKWSYRQSNGGGYSSGNLTAPAISPEEYLPRRAAEGVKLDPYSAEMLAALDQAQPERAKLFRNVIAIVSTEGTTLFTAWQEGSKAAPAKKTEELRLIIKLAALRQRQDLLDLSIDESLPLVRKLMTENTMRAREIAETIALAINGLDGLAARTGAFDRVARGLLGPPEAWPLYSEIDVSQSYVPAISQRGQIFQYFRSLFSEEGSPSRFALLRFLADTGLFSVGGQRGENSSLISLNGDAPALIASWRAGGLFAPGSAPARPLTEDGLSLMELVRVGAGGNQDLVKQLGELLLKVEGEDRFWARLLGAKLAGITPERLKEIESGVPTVSAWPEKARRDYGVLINAWFPDAAKQASGPLRKILAQTLNSGDDEIKRRAEQYLKDGFDSNFQPYSIDEKFGPLVQRLTATDPELAVKLWSKALDHFQKSSQAFNSSNGGFVRKPESYVHAQILQKLTSEEASPERFVSFLISFFRQNPDRVGLTNFSEISGEINRNLRNERAKRSEEFNAEKSVDMLKGEAKTVAGQMVAMVKDAGKEGRPVMGPLLMISYLKETNLSQPARGDVLKWLDDVFRKTEPETAEWIALSFANGNNSKSAPDPESIKRLQAQLIAFSKNDKVPLDLRICVVSELLAKRRPNEFFNEPACVEACTGLYRDFLGRAKEWGNDRTAAGLGALAEFDKLAQADALSLLAALEAKPAAIDQRSPQRAAGTMNRIHFALALKSGDGAVLQRAVRQSNGAFGGRLDYVVKLWQTGNSEAALALIARPGEYHKGSYWLFTPRDETNLPRPVFSKGIETSLATWLSTIPDAGQRFRVECLVSCAPDATGDDAPSIARPARLAALVKRFPAEAPQQKASRLEALIALGNEGIVIAPLKQDFSDAVRGQDLGSLLASREALNMRGNYSRENDDSYVMESLIRRTMRLTIEETGNAQLLLDQLNSLAIHRSPDNGYEVMNAFGTIGSWYGSFLALKIAALPVDQRAKPASQALEISRMLLGIEQWNSRSAAVGLAILSQAAAGNGAAFDTWLAALPPEQQATFGEVRKSGISRYLGGYKSSELAIPEYAPRRLALVTALLADPVTAAREIKHPMDISAIIDSGGFSLEDVTTAIAALPEGTPRRAEFLAERAGIIGWRTNNRDEALKTYDLAEAAAKDDEKALTYVRCYRALFLMERAGRGDEARKIAGSLNLDLLPPRERKQMQGFITPPPQPK